MNIVGLDYDPICLVSDPAMERFKQACVTSLYCKRPSISKGIMVKKEKEMTINPETNNMSSMHLP